MNTKMRHANRRPNPEKEAIHCLLINGAFPSGNFWNMKEFCKIMDQKYMSPPLNLITVAALLPQDWIFKLVDENIEELTEDHFTWVDLVCTGGMAAQQRRTMEAITLAHQKSLPVLAGGVDPTLQPELYREAEYLVLGEGEETIPLFVKDYLSGIPKGVYKSERLADMTKSPIPRFDFLDMDAYATVEVQFSRGCPYTCEFCQIEELYGHKMRIKDTDQRLTELQRIYELGYRGCIDIVDDNLIGNRPQIKKVLKALVEWSKERGYPFYYSITVPINMVKDAELLDLFQAIDTRIALVGIETAEETVIKAIDKKPCMNVALKEAVYTLYDYGMVVSSGFILGFDQESRQTADAIIDLIESTGICLPMINLLYASPASRLGQRLRSEGRLFQSWKDDTSPFGDTSGLNFVTIRPRNEILEDFLRILRHVFSPEHYFKKVLHTAKRVRLTGRYKPDFTETLVLYKAFLKICLRLGTRKGVAPHFWRLILSAFFKERGSFETAIELATMYLHYDKQAGHCEKMIREKISEIEKLGEKEYNSRMTNDKAPQV